MRKALLIHPEELSTAWIDRASAIGCDVLAFHPVGGPTAHRSLQEMLERLQTAEFRALIDAAKERGLEIEYEMHAARYLLPEALFAQHPEYFRMDGTGARTPDFNFCASSREALDVVAERALELVKQLYGSNHNYYLWLDDVTGSDCQCERCRALSASDRQLNVMNHILRRLRTEIPDARLAYLSYQDCLTVPETVSPEDGIFLEYAPFEKAKKENGIRLADLTENIEKLLAYFGKEGARVLEYWYDNSLFSGWKKPPAKFVPDHGEIRSEIAYYRSLGFDEVASFACYLGADYEALYGEPDLSAFADADGSREKIVKT